MRKYTRCVYAGFLLILRGIALEIQYVKLRISTGLKKQENNVLGMANLAVLRN